MNKLYEKLKHLETDDYQGRGDNYPASGRPDTLYVDAVDDDKVRFTASFKSTSEDVAGRWLSRFVNSYGFPDVDVEVYQDGDHHDDWVGATCVVG